MELIAIVAEYGPWAWIIGGLVLLALELVAPGGVLVWLGLAGVAVGGISLIVPMDWGVQWLVYGLLSIVCIVVWLKFFRPNLQEEQTDRPLLNRRAAQFVGKTTVLSEELVNGQGRVSLGDTIWRVTGPDLAAGTRVTITGAEGAVLIVEPAER